MKQPYFFFGYLQAQKNIQINPIGSYSEITVVQTKTTPICRFGFDKDEIKTEWMSICKNHYPDPEFFGHNVGISAINTNMLGSMLEDTLKKE